MEHLKVYANAAAFHGAGTGEGPPLLLHGWPEFWLTWEPVMARLADRLFAPDLRSSPRSMCRPASAGRNMIRCFRFPGPTGWLQPSQTSISLCFREWGTCHIARIPIAPQRQSPLFSHASAGAYR